MALFWLASKMRIAPSSNNVQDTRRLLLILVVGVSLRSDARDKRAGTNAGTSATPSGGDLLNPHEEARRVEVINRASTLFLPFSARFLVLVIDLKFEALR